MPDTSKMISQFKLETMLYFRSDSQQDLFFKELEGLMQKLEDKTIKEFQKVVKPTDYEWDCGEEAWNEYKLSKEIK